MGLFEVLAAEYRLAVLGSVVVASTAMCYVLTDVAFWYCKRLGGYPPSKRWHISQIAFWRYIRQHSRRNRSRTLLVMAIIHHVIAATGIASFFALYLVAWDVI